MSCQVQLAHENYPARIARVIPDFRKKGKVVYGRSIKEAPHLVE